MNISDRLDAAMKSVSCENMGILRFFSAVGQDSSDLLCMLRAAFLLLVRV